MLGTISDAPDQARTGDTSKDLLRSSITMILTMLMSAVGISRIADIAAMILSLVCCVIGYLRPKNINARGWLSRVSDHVQPSINAIS